MMHNIFSKLERGVSLVSLVFIAALLPFFASGTDFYVDASAVGGDGSQAAPFATIKAAVDAANGATAPSTIYVASGTYAITSASDFATISVPDLTITAAAPSAKPVIALDASLCLAQNNPVVFTVPQGSSMYCVKGGK